MNERPALASRTAKVSSDTRWGFTTYPMPPAACAAETNSCAAWTVRNTSAAVLPACLRCWASSSPDIPGIEMSSTMTSGCSVPAAPSAAGPSFTAPTTAKCGVSTAAARASIASLSSTSSTRTGSDDVVPDGILDELRGRLDVELLHHLVLVKGNGARREVQHARDLFHRTSLGEQLQHLALPRRQLVRPLLLAGVQERSDESLGHERRHVRSPLHHFTNRRRELGRGRPFQEVARGAGLEGVGRQFGLFVHRHEHELDVALLLLDLPACVETVQQRHGDVEDDDIVLDRFGGSDERPAAGPLAQDVANAREQLFERADDQRLIVCEEHSGSRHTGVLYPVFRDRSGATFRELAHPPSAVKDTAGLAPRLCRIGTERVKRQ